jgi:hypothetical protein
MNKDILQDTLNKFKNMTNYNFGNPLIINETTQVNLVKDIQKFLNNGYEQGQKTEITPGGKFLNKKVVGVKTRIAGKSEIATNITPMDLFYRLEDEFKSKINKGTKRETFLKQNIIDWWNSYDGLVNGNLSKNLSI